MLPDKDRLAGPGAILACAMLWSTSGLFIRLIDWHPMLIAGSRSFIAAFVLWALRRPLSGGRAAPVAPRDLPALALLGLCHSAMMILFVIANTMTGAANAIMLQYASPVWAALLALFFLRERTRPAQWAALALVGLGMFLVFSGGLVSGSLAGDALALASGVAAAGNTVILRACALGKGARRDPTDILLVSHAITAAFSAPFFLAHPPVLSAQSLLCVAYMGLIQIGLSSALLAYGIKRVPVTQAMLICSIEPVVNPLWVMLALGERPALSVVSGGAVIIAAVALSSVAGDRKKGAPAASARGGQGKA